MKKLSALTMIILGLSSAVYADSDSKYQVFKGDQNPVVNMGDLKPCEVNISFATDELGNREAYVKVKDSDSDLLGMWDTFTIEVDGEFHREGDSKSFLTGVSVEKTKDGRPRLEVNIQGTSTYFKTIISQYGFDHERECFHNWNPSAQ